MPLGNLFGSTNKGIMYNAATKKVVQSPTSSGVMGTGVAGAAGAPSTTSPLNPGVSSPSTASPSHGIMGALGRATASHVAGGGLRGIYDRAKAGQTAAAQPAQPAAFSYDPAGDEVWQKALAAAKANAQVQQGNDLAYLNKRGLVGSDAGNAEIAQIGQNAVSDLEANLLPQLAQQAYGRYRDDINQKNTDKQLDMQEGQMTGYYASSDMKKAYADANQAKVDYANAKTPEERVAAHNRAEAARSVIAQLGGNAGLVGSDVTAEQATANKGQYGIETAAQRQADIDNARNKRNDNLTAAASVSAMTGKVINPQDDWSGLFRQGGDVNTPLTMAGQNQVFGQGVQMAQLTGFMPDGTPTNAKQQQDLSNLWMVAANTGRIPDQLADMFGIPRGTATQDAAQFAQTFGLQQDDNDLAWIKADQDSGGGAAKYDGFTPSQVLSSVKDQLFDQYGDPRDGSKAVDHQKIYDTINAYGLPMGQDEQVMLAMGLSRAEIDAFDKASGVKK